MKEDDYHKFFKAMTKEISENEAQYHWSMIEWHEFPPGVKTITSIWNFKRKRYPNGKLNKYKARICAMVVSKDVVETIWKHMLQ